MSKEIDGLPRFADEETLTEYFGTRAAKRMLSAADVEQCRIETEYEDSLTRIETEGSPEILSATRVLMATAFQAGLRTCVLAESRVTEDDMPAEYDDFDSMRALKDFCEVAGLTAGFAQTLGNRREPILKFITDLHSGDYGEDRKEQ